MARVHRNSTTAALLVTLAVSALSGCVTVQRPLAPGPATAPAQRPEPRTVGRDETQVVQAPAREALEMVGPDRPPRTSASPSHRAAPTSAPTARDTPSADRKGQAPPARPGTGGNGQEGRPPAGLPGAAASMPGSPSGGPDLCALGRQYGGWRPGSQEAVICEETYGR
ncbi:hypothetical protein CNQ36_05270 [Streptomyces fungicidicus]|uniref:Lipoprotein n=1 Tax=Streptomyces fungicidicus TaxID=68203 RepID=A0A494UNE0_9ACTN|nr:hypothetical protein CNQ36_05270 [Streptomyces fungicidicus]QKV99262.1 hypothetical protein HUT14_05060 [Streptomyces sp. NA02536]